MTKVTKLIGLMQWCDVRIKAATAECNGDPHPDNPNPADKNRNCELWAPEIEKADEKILAAAKDLGFTDVDFGYGLVPVPKLGKYDVHLPFDLRGKGTRKRLEKWLNATFEIHQTPA